jgi:hypothetical protein
VILVYMYKLLGGCTFMEITVCRDDGVWSGELLRRSERMETELKFK